MTTLYERELHDEEFARIFAQEDLIEEAGELIVRAMDRENISKNELSQRIGVSRPYITQILSGSRNITLRTFADLMYAMNEKVLITSTSISDVEDNNTYCWVIKSPKFPSIAKWETETIVCAEGQAA